VIFFKILLLSDLAQKSVTESPIHFLNVSFLCCFVKYKISKYETLTSKNARTFYIFISELNRSAEYVRRLQSSIMASHKASSLF